MRWRQRESERAHNKHVTKGQRQCKRKKMMMMMTRTGKKVTKCWHRFFISFHFMPFHSIPCYSIPFCSFMQSSMSVRMMTWTCCVLNEHVCCLPFFLSLSPHFSLCNNYKDAMTRGQTMQNILMLKSHRETREKKTELN